MLNEIIITDITDIFTVFSPKGRSAKIQNRDSYALSFCEEGQITYTHNGNKFISDKDHAVILPQGQSYSIYGDKTGSFPVINFTCADILCDTVISLPIDNSKSYMKDFNRLQSLSLFGENRAEMMSIFYHMLHRLSSQNSSCQVILPAIKYLENNYQNPNLTNKKLAEQCKLSEVYFRRVFTNYYNMSPKQFLIDIRINKAKQLLSEGAMKINVIASNCGFSNQYHFCRIFKEKTGLTPTEYMKQNMIYKI